MRDGVRVSGYPNDWITGRLGEVEQETAAGCGTMTGGGFAVDGVEVCEACGMLRLTSFRTGRPSYASAGEVSLDDAVPR